MSRSLDGSQADTFVAAPRVVKPKKKYKEPQVEEDEELRVAYNNLMWEKRVVRGNTYAAMVTSKNVELPQKNTFKVRAQRQDDSALEALSHLGRRVNIEIFTDEFVQRLTDKPPCYEVSTETDFDISKPVVRLYMPQKTGTDQDTQIWDSDLFDFDYEVEPLLRVLCGKTLQTSRAEVLQEEELKVMKEKQKYYISQNQKEQKKIRNMEQHERNLKEQNDRKVALLKQRKQAHKQCHRKLLSRAMGKRLLRDLEPNTLSIIEAHGFFRDPLENKLVEQLLPNFYKSASDELTQEANLATELEAIFSEIQKDLIHQHRLSVETERTRRSQIVEQREERAREKVQRRKMRKQEQRMLKFLEEERIWLQKLENEAQEEEEKEAAQNEGEKHEEAS